jgi:hypothetical protein
MARILYNALVTPDGTLLESLYRWDYKTHTDAITDEWYMIDGGNDPYFRMSINKVQPKHICITTDDPHEDKRQYFRWGTYGENSDKEFKYILLKDMTSEHIKKVLLTQNRIKGSYVEELMESELQYRDELINKETK